MHKLSMLYYFFYLLLKPTLEEAKCVYVYEQRRDRGYGRDGAVRAFKN